MNQKTSQPLMRSHTPWILLGSAITLYGVMAALVGSWLSNRAMTGAITAGQYRSQLAAFDRTGGLIAGLLFLALFIFCAVKTHGIVRVAVSIGAVAGIAVALAPQAEALLFGVLGLPTMGAGSVLAGAISTLLFALPLIILFILLLVGRQIPKSVRWLSLLSILVVLGTSLYPIFVTVMAFLIRPGDPAVGRMIEVSTQVIKMRLILTGICFLLIAWVSMRFARSHPMADTTEPALTQAA